MTVGYQISRGEFQDFGHYRERLRCWETEAVQISRGPLNLRFDCLDSGNLILSRLRFDPAASLQSRRDKNYCSLGIHFSPKVWCGLHLPDNPALTITSGRETHVVSQEPFDVVNITVSRDMLGSWEAPLSQLAEWDRPPGQSVLAVDQHAAHAFRLWTELQFTTPVNPTFDDENSLWTAALLERLRWHLLRLVGEPMDSKPESSIHQVARYDLVLAALSLIQRRQEHRFTVSELSASLGVTSRALQYAFGGALGITPLQYLLAERLNLARYHLLSNGVGFGAITEVALDHKFENLSRFCHHYRRLFGERPSDTIRAARSAAAGL